MRLCELLEALECFETRGDQAAEIRGLARDSREVRPGDLFVCVTGCRDDGHRYALESLRRGAAAFVVQEWLELPGCVPQVRVADPRAALGRLAARFHGDPARRLRMIGVTGTNGKTTVTYLLEAVLRDAGLPVGRLGTIDYQLITESRPAGRTTPEAPELQAMLRRIADRGGRYAVVEVSSHALALQRVDPGHFDAAVFTNLTHDHLDFHGDMDNYLAAKGRLFAGLGRGCGKPAPYAVINRDDPAAERLVAGTRARVVTYGLHPGAELQAQDVDVSGAGARFRLTVGERPLGVALALPGLCNVYNALAVLAVARGEGLDLGRAAAALGRVERVPGRYEWLESAEGFRVLIDFAHNPDALTHVLQIARRTAQGSVIAVFGCEGRKDRLKRPLMGKVAAELADYCIITSDNVYDEDPLLIATEVEAGVRAGGKGVDGYSVILDRREAIRAAIARATPGAVVLIAGKGHETEWVIGDEHIPFNDRQVAEEMLAERGQAVIPRSGAAR